MSVHNHSEKSAGLMNTTVVLLVVFALLFVLLGLTKTLADLRQRQTEQEARCTREKPCPICPDCPPLAHDQPPIIVLTEAEGFSFATGRADIAPAFQQALREQIIPELLRLGQLYHATIIDCIGHTDEQQVFGVSNLDTTLLARIHHRTGQPLVAGSNADLGLLRCWEVIRFLQTDDRLAGFTLYGYSAGPTVLPSGAIAMPGQEPRDDATRRRIELRLRRAPGKSSARSVS